MQIEKSTLLGILSQVKAWRSIVTLRDSEEEGCLDVVYAPHPLCANGDVNAINTLTVPVGNGLFGGGDKIGRAVTGYMVDIRDAINASDAACEMKDRQINGYGMKPLLDEEESALSDIKSESALLSSCRLNTLDLSGSDFAAIAQDCMDFAARDGHEILQGVCIAFKRDRVDIVASDGVMLAGHTLPHSRANAAGDECKAVVPLCVFSLAKNADKVHIEFCDDMLGHLSYYTEDFRAECTFRYTRNNYPDYEIAITKARDCKEYIQIVSPDLLSRLKDVYNPIIELTSKGGRITATALATGSESKKDIGAIRGSATRDMRLCIKKGVLCNALAGGGAVLLYLKGVAGPLVRYSGGKTVIKLFMPMCAPRDGDDEWGMACDSAMR